MENPYAKMLRLVILSPLGIIGAGFLALGTAGIFLYGLLIAYKPSLVYQWQSWAYPLIFLLLAAIFMNASLVSLRRRSLKFLENVREEERRIKDGVLNEGEESSEFGPNTMDIEILRIVKDSGGYVPVLMQQLADSPFSVRDGIRSVAKMSLLGYVRLPGEESNTQEKGLKITITPRGLDALELPLMTFASLVPWDISLMLIRANILYREGNHEKAILEIYNLLERAFKVHLIPTIPGYREKWNEGIAKKVDGDEKEIARYSWKGEKTIASLNALWNFYKKNSSLGRKWSELADRTVKELEGEKERVKEELRAMDKIVDVIADTRSRYAHNKPGGKYRKDAYRLIRLAEILIGVLFEDMKERTFGN